MQLEHSLPFLVQRGGQARLSRDLDGSLHCLGDAFRGKIPNPSTAQPDRQETGGWHPQTLLLSLKAAI